MKSVIKKTILMTLLIAITACSTSGKSRAERRLDIAKIKTQLATEYMGVQNYREAVAAINEAIASDSSYDYAWLLKGMIYQALKTNDEAEKAFQRALALSPKGAEVNNNYGWFLCSTNRAAASMAYFDRALADPTYPTPHVAHMNKGICAARSGHYTEAASYLAKARAMAPWFTPVIKETARLKLMEGQANMAQQLMNQYQSQIEVLGPDDLLLGWKIARANGNTQAAYEYEATLRTRYPASEAMQEISGVRF